MRKIAGVELAHEMPAEVGQVATRSLALRFCLAVVLVLLVGCPAWAVNSVVVESKDVALGGATGVTIGVFLTNDVTLSNYVIPLEIRSVSNGAFVTALRRSYPSGTRLDGKMTFITLANQYEERDGTLCKTTQPDTGTTLGYKTILNQTLNASFPVTASPEGVMFIRGKFLEPGLPAGADGGAPQILMTVDIGSNHGTLEIDTVCSEPTNHIVFAAGETKLVPSFTKGVINVLASAVQYLGGDGIPRDYSLDQNYPNPFNASTVIKFNTKHDRHVRLDVLNILGQKVKTLVDEFRHYGPQAVDWDGTDLSGQAVPTGLYFYRLVTSDFSDVKKMVLLK